MESSAEFTGWTALAAEMARVCSELRTRVQSVQRELDRDFPGWKELRRDYPDQYWRHDARREFFVTVGTLLEHALLSYVLLRDHLGSRAWWSEKFTAVGDEKMNSAMKEFAVMIKWFSFHGLAMATEEIFRAVQRADPDAFAVEKKTNYQITKKILEVTELEDLEELFTLLRLTRNTIHTNGIYLPDYNGDKEIELDGRVFGFKSGEPLSWFTDPVLPWLIGRVVDALNRVVRSSSVLGLGHVPRGVAS